MADNIVAACVVVFNKGQILVVERREDKSKVGLPGGGRETGESVEQNAIRELAEETGIIATNIVPLYTGKSGENLATSASLGDIDKVCRCYLVKEWEGELKSSEEGVAKWVEPKQILNSPFRSFNENVLYKLSALGYEIF